LKIFYLVILNRMSAYNPPIENVPIFDSSLFSVNDVSLTKAEADKLYLHYPLAQGTENLLDIIVNGVSTLNGNVVQQTGKTITQQNITDNTTPNTLRRTDIYGDLNLRRPNTQGGALRLWDVVANSGYSCQMYQSNATAYWNNLVNSGFSIINMKNSSGIPKDIVKVSYDNMSIDTINPPTCSATQPASNDSSTIMPTTAWVQSAISAIPHPVITQYTYTQQFSGASALTNITIPTGCVKFDIKVFGTGGLAGACSNQPPDPSHIDYWVFIGGAGGGAGVAYKEGIPMIKQGIYYTNSLTYDNSSGTSPTGYCEVKFNNVSICKAYNGGQGTISAGGAGCSTAPVVSTTWGSWVSWNGDAGSPPTETYSSPNVGQIGGGNFNGGIIGYNKVNGFASGSLNQAGQGQQYSSVSGLFSWSASPINRGGCIITWYIQS
jgi:hypothetical protein